ncbi:hypothetical protein SSX86_012913 [Deinandra increscens subsp. villosa]|uniref:Peptidase A1 domain-containing protein n=1 Tax=Deinandra increscens subsp. villosa TaxID=3103831 RepID=A0AAP0D9L6_9ASTR
MAFSSLVAITLAIFYISGGSPAAGDSFTVNLLHRDSIDSPLYDHSMTFAQRLGHALQRSFINAKRFQRNQHGSTYQADLIPNHGEFLMNISFGNPPHKTLAIADTGSDLSWMQCKPCIKCYNHTGPLFNPKSSSTYQPVSCNSTTCQAMDTTSCSPMETCQFFESYADGSVANGTVAEETVTLGGRVIPNFIFGCSFFNDGIFQPAWAGIVGLGGGDFSLVTQIGPFGPHSKFSYCLIPYPVTNELTNKSSKMTFGDFDFGPNVVSTPLVLIEPKTYYFVTFLGISVGNTRINVSDHSAPSTAFSKGNMIVDSGTTLTMLPRKLYGEFETAIKNAINLRTMKDPEKHVSLCYRSAKITSVPKVMMHFDGADVELGRENVLVTVSKHISCLAFSPTNGLGVMGNIAQINHMVGFDLWHNTVSFKSTDCEKI